MKWTLKTQLTDLGSCEQKGPCHPFFSSSAAITPKRLIVALFGTIATVISAIRSNVLRPGITRQIIATLMLF